MKLLVAIAPDRYRDEELDNPLAVFRKAGIGFDIASVTTGTCTGMLGGTAHASVTFDHADPSLYHGIVIIGGTGSPAYLWENTDLARLVKTLYSEKKVVAAICLSPVVLARAGILRGRKATLYRTPESLAGMRAGGAVVVQAPVVIDGTVITADGPGSATAFGETIVSALNP